MDRHLFLFGSGPPFTSSLAKKFSALAGGEEATVAVLYEAGEGSEAYRETYIERLKENNINSFLYFPLDESTKQEQIEELKTCTGVIIGGGDTEKYQKCIVETAVKEVIVDLYAAGRPIAGFSAGALITPTHCVISPKDNPAGRQLYKNGLGLIHEKVISVHFDTWEEEFSLKIAMKKTHTNYGYGIDEETGLYFKNEKVEEKDGKGKVHFYKQKDSK